MSNFLLHVAARGAGLSLTRIQPPVSPPSGFDLQSAIPEDTDAVNETGPAAIVASSLHGHAIPAGTAAPVIQRFAAPESPSAPASTAPAAAPHSDGSGSVLPMHDSSSAAAIAASEPVRIVLHAAPGRDVTLVDDVRSGSPGSTAIAEPRGDLMSGQDARPAWRLGPSTRGLDYESIRRDNLIPAFASIRIADSPAGAPLDGRRPSQAPLIRPRIEPTVRPFELAAIAPAPPPSSPLPIHVRIGRIEVRGAASTAPQPTSPTLAPPPLGFAAYARLRKYRS